MQIQSFQSSILKTKHAFFTRQGGVSSRLFSSFNFSERDPDKGAIAQNVRIATSHLGVESLFMPSQVHGNKVLLLDHDVLSGGKESKEADAIVTKIPSVAIGVITADCCPILMIDHSASVIAAAHAGWKGALSGIISATIEAMVKMGAKHSNICAAIGPTIAQTSYEVGHDMYEAFTNTNPEAYIFFSPCSSVNKCMFNLPGYVKYLLIKDGIECIDDINIDTYSSDNFFSCRRAYHRKEPSFGCQLSAITIDASSNI